MKYYDEEPDKKLPFSHFIYAPQPGICEEHKMSETRYFFYQFMHSLFWRTLCPQPDGKLNMRLHGWPYNFTGKIAGYFHRKVCKRCAIK